MTADAAAASRIAAPRPRGWRAPLSPRSRGRCRTPDASHDARGTARGARTDLADRIGTALGDGDHPFADRDETDVVAERCRIAGDDGRGIGVGRRDQVGPDRVAGVAPRRRARRGARGPRSARRAIPSAVRRSSVCRLRPDQQARRSIGRGRRGGGRFWTRTRDLCLIRAVL